MLLHSYSFRIRQPNWLNNIRLFPVQIDGTSDEVTVFVYNIFDSGIVAEFTTIGFQV
jgi:hypothetical protein